MSTVITGERPDTADAIGLKQEAIGLYEADGFYRIPPFGPYTDDSLSLYYEKRLRDRSHLREQFAAKRC